MNQLQTAQKWLQTADAILITASNGLSISEGVNIFADDENFENYFYKFREKYGVRSILEASASPYFSQEDREEFSSILEKFFITDYKGHEVFHELSAVVGDKDYFIVTSNTDTHFQINGFNQDKIYEIEGNILTGIGFNHPAQIEQKEKFMQFLDNNMDKNLVVLELGIGSRNQLIKAPTMQLVASNKNFKFITLNLGNEINIPDAIKEQSVALIGSIDQTLNELLIENAYEKKLKKLYETLEDAEFILIGGAAGMSAAGGASFYEKDESYLKVFGKFEDAYQTGSIMNLFYKPTWESRGHHWAALVTMVHWILNENVYQQYKDLKAILKDKDYEIVTTNQDTQFVKAFPEKDVAVIQGDWHFLQCSKRCHDELYPSKALIDDLYTKIDGIYLDEKYIPHCDQCGAELEGWVRGFTFLEGAYYHLQYALYRNAVEKARGKKSVFIDLGAGLMTPMFIKEPFMNFTLENPKATYVTINPKDAITDPKIEDQTIAISEDIAKVLSDLKNLYYKN